MQHCMPSPNYNHILHFSAPKIIRRHSGHLCCTCCPGAHFLVHVVFHCLGIFIWRWLDRYRIRKAEKVKSRNLAMAWEECWSWLCDISLGGDGEEVTGAVEA
ncbi:hypothetical protein EDD22DRAFT_437969 [Suillus occidentalis]|nr:hypothetical protein EDD22DRAFT_437969 [Suillus occidentalis]